MGCQDFLRNKLFFQNLLHKTCFFQPSEIAIVDTTLRANAARFWVGLGELRDHGLHRLHRRVGNWLKLIVEIIIAFLQRFEILPAGELS
ncbi:MAG: hypothetical protein HW419_4112 [Deltaproteobacteria bacterium]|nr:hypothetical protein [Deltaproteobacteria bacterium]